MFQFLKNKIKEFVELRYSSLRMQQQANFDFIQISKLFQSDSFIPFSRWSLSPSIILHVLNDIIINKRKTIVEFGAGASTLYIAQLIKKYNLEAKFFSVESNEAWAEELKCQLILYELQDYVKVIYAPIVKVDRDFSFKNQETWYDFDSLGLELKDQKFDLVVVDGPYGGTTSFARYTAIPFLENKLSEKYAIFLDDIHRKEEGEILLEWKNLLKVNFRKYNNQYAVLFNGSSLITEPYRV